MFASNTPSITVIVPNFNHGHLISECITAIQTQDFENYKVLIVDDHSSDRSVEIIKNIIKKDSRFELIQLKKNLGVVELQNLIVAKVNSEYLYLAAADDYILPEFFSALVGVMAENPEIAFATTKSLIPLPTGKYKVRPMLFPSSKTKIFDGKQAANQLLRMDFLYITGATLLRTQMFKAIGPLNANLGALADGIHLRRLAAKYGYAYVNKFGLVWRRVEEGFSVTELNNNANLEKKLKLAENILKNETTLHKSYASKYYRRMKFISKINSQSKAIKFSNRKIPIYFWITFTFLIRSGFFYLKYHPFSIKYIPKLLKAQKAL